MENRIYLVTDNESNQARLIRAGTKAQALRHAVGGRFTAKQASGSDVANLMAAGAPVESVKADVDAAG